ncbi:hypothetical protein [Zunongwangia sp. HRR-M8]|uniref:hypothetical protein n=1 Tax=Zunongwangia sp. HRR-M8 TaxID=3015170 RepID=UPI0022DDEA01|nr:hypothetical protein [Zunongwangia sp. HRR-M8]WBL23805.1 hypothetical protein PBT89_07545 [Zunongwangia sp. HRR-M8]
MKSRINLILTVLFFCNFSFSQPKNTSNSKEFFYNISIGAVIGTVGAIINKEPKQQFGKTFFKGFYQGALGGYITFESKRLIRTAMENKSWEIFWAAKVVNAGGVSIKENAALNKNFWEKWHINIGFNRIEFETKDNFKVNYKVMPIALVHTIGISVQTKFELEKTLKTGEFIFSSNTSRFPETNSIGRAFPGNIVLYTPYKNDFEVISHEIIHLYQSNDFSQLETFLNKPINHLNAKSDFLNSINNYIHYDFRYIPEKTLNIIENNNAYFYYDNFFEREAGFYSGSFNNYYLR